MEVCWDISASGKKARAWNTRWVCAMQNETLSKGRMRIKQNDEDGKKEWKAGLCFIFIFFFQVVLRLPEMGSLLPGCCMPCMLKHNLGAGYQLLRHPRLVAPTQMTTFSISLQCLQAVAHVREECCHCSFKGFHQAQAVFEALLHEWITLLFDAVTWLRKSALPQIASWSQPCWALPW